MFDSYFDSSNSHFVIYRNPSKVEGERQDILTTFSTRTYGLVEASVLCNATVLALNNGITPDQIGLGPELY